MFTEHKMLLVRAIAASSVLAMMGGCQQKAATPVANQGATEVGWAREALDRNPNIEVVAVDTAAGVFTIRSKSTGEMTAVPVGDLAAAPISQLVAPRPAVASTPPAPPASPAAPAAPASPRVEATAPPAQVAARAPEQAASANASTAPQGQDPGYVIERTGGQIKVSGPGVSIVSSGPASAAAAANGAGAQRAEPIICEGNRRLHLDGRTLNVDGNAVTARGGCELYITNSRIVASGMGVVVQGATVHIANSYVEGATASFQADGGAKVFVRNSTFQGVPRRDQLAQVQDQGGNRWR